MRRIISLLYMNRIYMAVFKRAKGRKEWGMQPQQRVCQFILLRCKARQIHYFSEMSPSLFANFGCGENLKLKCIVYTVRQ